MLSGGTGPGLLAVALQELGGHFLRRQRQQLQKEWLMLLSHIRRADRLSDGGGGGSRGARAIKRTPALGYSHRTGVNIANGRTALISWRGVGQ